MRSAFFWCDSLTKTSSWKERYKTAKIISLKKSFMSKKWIAFSRSMPWLCFDESGDGSSLFYSQAGSIFKTTPLQCRSKPSIFSNFSEKNVCNKFAVDGGLIFGGSMGGSALLWNSQSKRPLSSVSNVHSSDIRSCDLRGDVAISGGRDANVVVWGVDREEEKLTFRRKVPFLDWICSVRLSRDQRMVAVGSNCYTANSAGLFAPLSLCDVETGQICAAFGDIGLRKGSGISDVRWLNEHCLLSANYDGIVRIHDTRGGNTGVWRWEEPFGATVFSVACDELGRGIVVSSSPNGVIWLLDSAFPRSFKGVYVGEGRLPVFCAVRIDRVVYAASDAGIHAVSLI